MSALATPCVEWVGARHRQGYGSKRVGAKTQLAHRLAYEAVNGPIPAGLKVLHRCDNPPCVNPEHLFLGTQLDNMRDCASKGRNHVPTIQGSACPWARLSEADAALIRHLAECGVRQPRLAHLYGISQTMVSRIKLRKAWAHVPDLVGAVNASAEPLVVETIRCQLSTAPLDASGTGPKWNVIIPLGEYHGPTLAAHGGSFTYDTAYFETLIANWKANGSFRIPVRWGHEHKKNDDPAKARDLDRKAANVIDLRVSDLGLEGLTAWNDSGRKDVVSGEFDSWSAEYQLRHLNRRTGAIGGPLLTGIGLTGDPFFNLMPPVAASAHASTNDAAKWLKAAIARHERHMSGAEATSDDSQMKMMDEMRNALAAIEEMKPPVAASAGAESTDTNPNQEQMMNPEQLKKWALSLGLSADATAEQCISASNAKLSAAEAKSVSASAVPAEVITAAVKPVQDQVIALSAALEAEKTKGLERDVDQAIEVGKRGDGKLGRAITADLRTFILATAKGPLGLEGAQKLIAAIPAHVPLQAIGHDTKQEEGTVSASAANEKLTVIANENQAKGVKNPMEVAIAANPDLAKAARSLTSQSKQN